MIKTEVKRVEKCFAKDRCVFTFICIIYMMYLCYVALALANINVDWCIDGVFTILLKLTLHDPCIIVLLSFVTLWSCT